LSYGGTDGMANTRREYEVVANEGAVEVHCEQLIHYFSFSIRAPYCSRISLKEEGVQSQLV
jgi:hypothetical protein